MLLKDDPSALPDKPDTDQEQVETPSGSDRRRGRGIAFCHSLVGLGILAAFTHHLWKGRAQFEAALSVSTAHIVALAVVIGLTWTVAAAQNAVLYRASGVPIGFRENWLLTVGAAFGSYLPMQAGTAVRFHYMKSVHGLRYTRSGSISWLRAILTTLSTGMLGLVGTVGLALTDKPPHLGLPLAFAGMLVLPVMAFCWRGPQKPLARTRGDRMVRDFFEGLRALQQQQRASLYVFLLIVLQQLCLGIRFFVATQATGQTPSLMLLCVLAPLAVFVSFVSLTPGALGLREVVMGYATYATGTSFDHGLYVGTFDRAVLLVMLTLFGGTGLIYLWYKFRRVDTSGRHAPARAPATGSGP